MLTPLEAREKAVDDGCEKLMFHKFDTSNFFLFISLKCKLKGAGIGLKGKKQDLENKC